MLPHWLHFTKKVSVESGDGACGGDRCQRLSCNKFQGPDKTHHPGFGSQASRQQIQNPQISTLLSLQHSTVHCELPNRRQRETKTNFWKYIFKFQSLCKLVAIAPWWWRNLPHSQNVESVKNSATSIDTWRPLYPLGKPFQRKSSLKKCT